LARGEGGLPAPTRLLRAGAFDLRAFAFNVLGFPGREEALSLPRRPGCPAPGKRSITASNAATASRRRWYSLTAGSRTFWRSAISCRV